MVAETPRAQDGKRTTPPTGQEAKDNSREHGPHAPGFVGVFDSGVGGISVLRACVAELPGERYVYYGDTANTPYGDKDEAWVRNRSFEIVDALIRDEAKAIVIACNTATSAAAAALRDAYPDTPIVGIEPALKPAACAPEHDRILVMATRTTLDLDKFHALARAYGSDSIVYTQACPGLADTIETQDFESPEIYRLLENLIGRYATERIDSVVLGCTHYVFIRKQIASILGSVRFFDGNAGTAQQLVRVLKQKSLLAQNQPGSVVFRSSKNDQAVFDRYLKLFEAQL